MSANRKLQRLYVTDDLAAGRAIALGRDQSHYLTTVLRMRAGTELLVFNGRDGEWRAAIAASAKKSVTLEIGGQTRTQAPAPDLVYCFAPLKSARLDYTVQKAVEMGAGTIQPVLTQHVQTARLARERMAANAVEAAEQCGALSVPAIGEPVKLDRLLDGWPPDRRLIFCDESAEGMAPLPVLGTIRETKLGLIVGPEGGFSEAERAMLAARPFVTAIALGPRILRADTAAVAALALVQAAVGDWR